MGAARAADALADGRTAEARSHLAEVVYRRPDDDEALVGLARTPTTRSPAAPPRVGRIN